MFHFEKKKLTLCPPFPFHQMRSACLKAHLYTSANIKYTVFSLIKPSKYISTRLHYCDNICLFKAERRS